MSNSLQDKLKAIRDLANECLAEVDSSSATNMKGKDTGKATPKPKTNVVLQIVNKVGDCDEADPIQAHILDKPGAEGRVLLPFFISHKHFDNAWLTSGDVEKITSELGVKIDKKNVTNYFKRYKNYLEAGDVRKRGRSTSYRMNRRGMKRFEELIDEKNK